jgi:hypothetical protein
MEIRDTELSSGGAAVLSPTSEALSEQAPTPDVVVEPRSTIRAITALDVSLALALGILSFVILLPYLQPHLNSLRGEVGFQYDEGTELYNAELLRRGWALYREAWDFKGPVSYAVWAFGFVFCEASVKNGRIITMVVIGIWAGLAFLCGRAITQRYWPGVLLALFIPLCIWPNWPYAYNEYVSQCLLVGALLASLHAQRRPRLWLVSGALASLAFWTSLAQGAAGMLSLGFAATLLAWVTGGDVRRVAKGYALGVAAPCALILLWLAWKGALRAGLHAVFVFPFTNYMDGNATAYGFDRQTYLAAWSTFDKTRVLAAHAISGATVHTPRIALAVAVVMAALLLDRAFFRHYTGRVKREQDSGLLARAVLPASLVATALPPFMGQGRSDLCHLGFIEGTSSLALVVLVADFGRLETPRSRRALRIGQALLALGAASLLCLAGFFVWKNAQQEFPREDLDSATRYSADLIAARTRPSDRVYVLPAGGYTYLYAKRDMGIRFPVLDLSPYYAGHWRKAANDVINNRPRLLLVGSDLFGELVKRRPEIAPMYFGYGGNYILDERRPGPALEAVTHWRLEEAQPNGLAKTDTVTLTRAGSAAHYTASFPDAGTCLAALDEDRLSLFRGDTSYVGLLSADGRKLTGTVFVGSERRSFNGEQIPEPQWPVSP